MPHSKQMTLAEFLNNDDLVRGLDPLEVRALTQLESFNQIKPGFEIDTEKFNELTKTYKIIFRNKFSKKKILIQHDNLIKSGILNKLSGEEAFKLGYSFAFQNRNKKEDF